MHQPPPPHNVFDVFARQVHANPQQTAIIDDGAAVTYGALAAAALRAVEKLTEAGCGLGSIVGVAPAAGSIALHLATVLALARIGATQILLSRHEMASDEAASLLRRHNASMLTSSRTLVNDPGLPRIVFDDALLNPSAPVPVDVPHVESGDRPWLLARSSGTTGRPKEFAVTHATEIARQTSKPSIAQCLPGERTMTLVDLSFTMGLRWALWALFDGAVLVAPSVGADARAVFQTIDRHGVTSFLVTPTHLQFLLKDAAGDRPRLPLLRMLYIGSAAVSRALYQQVKQLLTANVLIFYGTNETWTVAYATSDLIERYPGTSGVLAPGVELQIVDPQDRPVPPGVVGEVRLRSPGMISGYVDDAEATALQFREGWFYPGDAGTLDQNGLLFLKGRIDDTMNFDGMLISPAEIEQILVGIPGLIEAAAFGVPSEGRGDVPFLAVVAERSIDVDELLSYCRSRLGHRAPVAIVQVKALPRNPMGKVLRRNLALAVAQRVRLL
jgi:acyl-CoA synthetase (AMP-forming)/AMP-acid ligase II